MKPEAGIQDSESTGSSQFAQDGFQILKPFIDPVECDRYSAVLTPLFEQQQSVSKSKIGGVRNLLRENSLVSQFARSPKVLSALMQFSSVPAFPVRAIFFDKNSDANWLVPWHQDLAIAVRERIETPGFTGWSIKEEVLHVHPPREILEGMLTLRLHLDDCDVGNGALKVIGGSHLHGKLAAADISAWTARPTVCELAKGDALLMRPLLLHASSPSENPRHRRVLHIEYATQELPNGLQWLQN